MNIRNVFENNVLTFLGESAGPARSPERVSRAAATIIEPAMRDAFKVLRTSGDLSQMKYAQGFADALEIVLRLVGHE